MTTAGAHLLPMTMNNHLVRITVSIGVSLMILALLSMLVLSGHDPANRPGILALLANTLPAGIAVFLLLHIIGLVLRAIRYRLLIDAAGESTPGFGAMFMVTAFRSMMVDMLPARAGELAYAAVLNRAYQVPLPACLSSLGLAVVFDFVALAVIILLAIPAFALAGDVAPWLWGALVMASLVAAIAVIGVVRILPWLVSWLQRGRHGGWIGRSRARLGHWLGLLNDAVVQTRAANVTTRVLGLSVLIRAIKYLSLFALFVAVAEPSFPELRDMPRASIFAATVGAEMGAALPIPAFMSFGTYEAGGTLVLSLLGIDSADGLLTLLAVHIWSQAIDYTLGGLCLVLVILLTRRGNGPSTAPTWKRFVALGFAAAVLLAGAMAMAWQYRANLKLGALTAPPAGEDLREQMSEAARQGFERLGALGARGFVTWSSNRFGNHDILRMSLPDGRISRLTRHPHTETYPRISPDGRRLVFVRSRQPWVSQRNTIAWDLHLLDLETGRERRLDTAASYPFWIDDNTVGYLKDGVTVLSRNLRDDRVRELFRSSHGNTLPAGTPITSPDINPNTGELVFTARQSAIGMNTGFWGTAIWQNNGGGSGPIQGVLDGCELNWSFDGGTLYQVGHGGRQKTMFYRIDPATLAAEPLLDLPGEFSHEYWPEDSNDGRWLVFGASRGDHEHDVADYELFIWPIGASVDAVTRLTFHSGNDNWPDVFIHQ